MTPLTTKPTVIALVDENGVLIRTATNIAPNVEVIVTNSKDTFTALTPTTWFNANPDEIVPEPTYDVTTNALPA